MSVSLWLSHYNSKAISHIFKCLPFWVDGWSLFSQFTLFSACWDSAVCMGAESSSMPCCLLLYLSATQVPSLLHRPSSFLHFQIQNCTLKLQISNFRFKSAMLLLFCHLSTSHSSSTVFPFCWTLCTFLWSSFLCKLVFLKWTKNNRLPLIYSEINKHQTPCCVLNYSTTSLPMSLSVHFAGLAKLKFKRN